MRRPLRWLHFSDMHLAPGEARWWQLEEDLRNSIASTVKAIGGAPDLVLLTGDLTDSGAPEQFDLVDVFFDKLEGWLGARPFVVAVPGNHDVVRPQGREARAFAFLDKLVDGKEDPDLADQLWRERDATPIAPLFAPYIAWSARRMVRQARPDIVAHPSHFPGDLLVTVAIPGVTPVTIVGLNSTWLQYSDSDYSGRLMVPREQFYSALGGPKDDPLAPLRSPFGQHNLLLMHHAPARLSEAARRVFLGEIFLPERFAAALVGQLQGAHSERLAVWGGKFRHIFQAASLFGRQMDRSGQSRPQGYAAGILADNGELRVWPMLRIRRGDHVHAFVEDQAFTVDADGPHRGSFVLRERAARYAPPADDILDLYLDRLGRECSYIQLDGIGHAGEAARYSIDEMYVPLMTRTHLETDATGVGRPLALLPNRKERTNLATLLPNRPRLLFEGEPGSGKTTFLLYIAHALREAHCGRSRTRPEVVALTEQGRVPLPIFARIAAVMSRPGASSLALRSLLLDHLAERTCPETQLPAEGTRDPGWDARRTAWDERLRQGDALLLLDGLDEVADGTLRLRVFDMLDDAMNAWPRCRVIVTSRPFSLEELLRRQFHREVVAPFDDEQVHDYARRWVAVLYADPEARPMPQEDYTARLFAALREHPEIRLLAENPVMLTCLCVVHWHRQGSLPEGRSEVYREVIRWLLRAREGKRCDYKRAQKIEPMSVELFEEALAALALEMMRASGGKRVGVDFASAVHALTPLMRRYFLTDDEPSFVRQLADLLRFECESSGVLHEQGQAQLKFRHLTFQEYLAARRLAYTDNAWNLLRTKLDDRQWREAIDLYPACLLERGGTQVDALMEQVLGMHGNTTKLAEVAKIVGLVGRFLVILRPFAYRLPEPQATIYGAFRERALGIFTAEGAAGVAQGARIAAAEALGRAGDPRHRAESFRERLLAVPGTHVWLAKYPITVEEFERFVRDNGYDHRELWGEEGWMLREYHEWTAPDEWNHQLATPNRPVVGVSWFEATAYCHWLTTSDVTFRLPTRKEWLAAAAPDERTYPWGNKPEPDTLRANFDKRVGGPTPVGIYPAGNGKFGHCDLAGNVWEWSFDIEPGTQCTDDVTKKIGFARELYGGSWHSGVRTNVRCILWPWDRDDSRGFRVASEAACT